MVEMAILQSGFCRLSPVRQKSVRSVACFAVHLVLNGSAVQSAGTTGVYGAFNIHGNDRFLATTGGQDKRHCQQNYRYNRKITRSCEILACVILAREILDGKMLIFNGFT